MEKNDWVEKTWDFFAQFEGEKQGIENKQVTHYYICP